MAFWRIAAAQLGLTVSTPTAERRAEIAAAVERDGSWRDSTEWRISTVTTTEITCTGLPGHRAYRVRVDCDFVLEAHCPTIERAIEMAHAYEGTVLRLWTEIGWPSWATKAQLQP